MGEPFLDDRANDDAPLLARAIGAPSGVYCTGDEQLRVTAFNAAANVTLAIRGRFLDIDGHLQPIGESLTPATDRSSSAKTMRLGRGWLQGVHVVVSSGTPITGQCFVILSLVRGDGAVGLDFQTLAAGYVTVAQRIVFPGSPVLNSLDGAGALRSITAAVPAAGAEISETVPTGARWDLLAIRAQFSTSVTVANRIPQFVLDDGALEYGRFAVTQALTASATWFVTGAAGASRVTPEAGFVGYAALPSPCALLAGHRIRTVTTAIQAADQYSAIQYLVRERIEG